MKAISVEVANITVLGQLSHTLSRVTFHFRLHLPFYSFQSVTNSFSAFHQNSIKRCGIFMLTYLACPRRSLKCLLCFLHGVFSFLLPELTSWKYILICTPSLNCLFINFTTDLKVSARNKCYWPTFWLLVSVPSNANELSRVLTYVYNPCEPPVFVLLQNA